MRAPSPDRDIHQTRLTFTTTPLLERREVPLSELLRAANKGFGPPCESYFEMSRCPRLNKSAPHEGPIYHPADRRRTVTALERAKAQAAALSLTPMSPSKDASTPAIRHNRAVAMPTNALPTPPSSVLRSKIQGQDSSGNTERRSFQPTDQLFTTVNPWHPSNQIPDADMHREIVAIVEHESPGEWPSFERYNAIWQYLLQQQGVPARRDSGRVIQAATQGIQDSKCARQAKTSRLRSDSAGCEDGLVARSGSAKVDLVVKAPDRVESPSQSDEMDEKADAKGDSGTDSEDDDWDPLPKTGRFW